MNKPLKPDYLVAPGEVLAEHLEVRGFNQKEFASRVEISEKHISQIMTGKRSITAESACKFEVVLGIPAKFWMDLESQYKLDKLRIQEGAQDASISEWAEKFPTKEMIARGWLPEVRSREEKADALLRFFSVTSPEAWEHQFESMEAQCRRAVTKKASVEALSAWIQRLYNTSRAVELSPYSETLLKGLIPSIKACFQENPSDLQERLKGLFAKAGVYLSFEPHLPRTYVNGVTIWILDQPAIQLSSRYPYLDIMAFSLFHELAHTLLHKGKASRFVDLEVYGTDPLEDQANAWAADQLISRGAWESFTNNSNRSNWTLPSVLDFAKTQQVHPGTVVGRLAWEKKITWNDKLCGSRVKMPSE